MASDELGGGVSVISSVSTGVQAEDLCTASDRIRHRLGNTVHWGY